MGCERFVGNCWLAVVAAIVAACSQSSGGPDTGLSVNDGGRDAAVVVADTAVMDAALPDVSTTDAASGFGDAGDSAILPDLGEAGPWRSALYPEDWSLETVDGEGRYLPDFSYAGYRNGTAEPDTSEWPTFAIADYGADPTGQSDSRAAFQAAIDAASVGGGVVVVGAGLYRIDDRLTVTASNVVIRGEGAANSRLWFTRSAGMTSQSHLTFRGDVARENDVLLVADGEQRSRRVRVADPSGLSVGDDVAVGWTITPEFVAEHSMTGVWRAFNDTWQPFFRRQVVSIEEDEVELDLPLHYPAKMRDGASIRRETGYLRDVGLEDVGIADAVDWDSAWEERQVHVIELTGVTDGWVKGVESFPSPGAPASGDGSGAHLQNGGILVLGSKRVTVSDSSLAEPQNRGVGGCGYLFEVRQSSDVLFRDLVARAGRHNFIQNWGFGTSGVVWLRVHSSAGRTFSSQDAVFQGVGDSEFHHSLAMANLIDSSTFDDGFNAVNRKDESTGAGHTATGSVFWNVSGTGKLRSFQFAHGYVIGTAAELAVQVDMIQQDPALREQLEELGPWTATWPVDWLEGKGRAGELEPPSLYEDQRRRR